MLIPCIDLQNGQAVQLVHGRKRELAIADVFGLLERFADYKWLHVIDLDAAMRKGQNNRLVKELCRRASHEQKMKVRAGGGIRTVRASGSAAAMWSGASDCRQRGVPRRTGQQQISEKFGEAGRAETYFGGTGYG